MGYKLLGMAVWKGGKLYLHRRYGSAHASKPLLAGGLVLALVGVLLIARHRETAG